MNTPKIEKLTYEDTSKNGFPVFTFYAENENLRGLVRRDEMVIRTGLGWYCENREISQEVLEKVKKISTTNRNTEDIGKDYINIFKDYPQYFTEVFGMELASISEKSVFDVFFGKDKKDNLKEKVSGTAFIAFEDKLLIFKNDNIFHPEKNELVNKCLEGYNLTLPNEYKKVQEKLKEQYELGLLSPDLTVSGKVYEIFKSEMKDSLIILNKDNNPLLKQEENKIFEVSKKEDVINNISETREAYKIPVFDYKGVRLY